MDKPDQRLFEQDVASAEFRIGVAKRMWDLAAPAAIPDDTAWPHVFLWIAAALRQNAPDRFYFSLDASGYRSVPPTGTLWNPDQKVILEHAKRPKGRPGSRFAMVFRTDWNNGSAFYHPYDRTASQGHTDWPKQQPNRIWTPNHTIVDYVDEFHALLNSGDYLGV